MTNSKKISPAAPPQNKFYNRKMQDGITLNYHFDNKIIKIIAFCLHNKVFTTIFATYQYDILSTLNHATYNS